MLLDINGKEVMPYDDCVIEDTSGRKRIGRLERVNGKVTDSFRLASYQDRKCQVVWNIKDIKSIEIVLEG